MPDALIDQRSLIEPLDAHNRELLGLVHPADWVNPNPAPKYDLVVIGGGTAGLVSAVGAAGLGARVALVERGLLGGDCLNSGCVPSKALLRSARAVHALRQAGAVGVHAGAPRIDFAQVMARLRARRAEIGHHDSAVRLANVGVDVFFGDARFDGPRSLGVGDRRLVFRRAVIATGGRPTLPPVPGLADVQPLTNENLFWLTEQPKRLLIVGAGPIGCEMAQAFALLGTRVTVLDLAAQILPREDPDAADIVRRQLVAAGVAFELGVTLHQVRRLHGEIRVEFERSQPDRERDGELSGDHILVAAGRAPNVEDLDLTVAGVERNKDGVVVNDRLQTTNRRIFAAGDVCSRFKFTHAADAMARIVIQNALFFGRRKASALVIPWCTYTFPEVAHVGADAQEARDRGAEMLTVPLSDVDRAVVDDETEGFVRVAHIKGRPIACTIVAPHAGELIGQMAYLMRAGGSLADLSATIYPYPTVSEALRKAGDSYRRSALTPIVRRLFERYFAFMR